jgi:hypothetical protein
LAWQHSQATVKGITMMLDEKFTLLRMHRNNISRYRRLLKTKLTECERQFIERRLSEERSAMERLAASTFPFAFQIPTKPVDTAAPGSIRRHGGGACRQQMGAPLMPGSERSRAAAKYC